MTLSGFVKADLSCNGLGRNGVITRDHHDLDAGGITHPDGIRHGRTDGVLQTDEADELKGEVMLDYGQGFSSRK